MSPKLKSLLVPMHDYASQVDDETNRWFDFDHVPERLSCEGFLSAERFELSDLEPPGWHPGKLWTKYLNVYTLTSLDVLEAAAYRSYFEMNEGQGTHWRQVQEAKNDSLGLRSPSRGLRSVWRQRPSPWLRSLSFRIPPPRVLFIELRDVNPRHDEEVNKFFEEERIPELLSLPGFLHCERFEAGETLPERPGRFALSQPRYMDVYDISAPEIITGSAYALYQDAPSNLAREVEQWITIRGCGVYVQRSSPWLLEAWDPKA